MAKKIYHLPLQNTRVFMKEHKSHLNKLLKDRTYLRYTKTLGYTYFICEIEKFLAFVKIDTNIAFAMQSIKYFCSRSFLQEVYTHLQFSQFEMKNINEKEFFYGFCYLLKHHNQKLFEFLLFKLFLHYHASLNQNTDTQIEFKDMAVEILKFRKQKIRESFGEENTKSFFKLYVDENICVDIQGKSIKTLRKKAYKELFYTLIDT